VVQAERFQAVEPRATIEKRRKHSYVGLSKQLSAFDVMIELLDFYLGAMLYRAESVLIRRFAPSRVQIGADATYREGNLATRFRPSNHAEPRFATTN
jgi:hypothetical protein